VETALCGALSQATEGRSGQLVARVLLIRNFIAERADQVWLVDFSCSLTDERLALQRHNSRRCLVHHSGRGELCPYLAQMWWLSVFIAEGLTLML
jgi:hypothetical protein